MTEEGYSFYPPEDEEENDMAMECAHEETINDGAACAICGHTFTRDYPLRKEESDAIPSQDE